MVEAEMAFTKSLEDVLEVNIWFNIEMILNAEFSKIIRFQIYVNIKGIS